MVTTPPQREDLELRDYLAVFRRRWRLMAVVFVVVVGLIMAYTLTRPKLYTANATVILDPSYSDTVLNQAATSSLAGEDQTINEADLMRTASVQEGVAKIAGYEPEVRIRVIENADASKTRTIEVSSKQTSPDAAVRHATDFAKAFREVRTETIQDDLDDSIAGIEHRMTSLDQEVSDAQDRIAEIDRELDKPTDDTDVGVLRAERSRLVDQIAPSTIAQRQQSLQANLDALNVAAAINDTEGVFRISPAEKPTSPSDPKPQQAFLLAIALGALLAMIVAFLRDYLDTSIRTKEDLDRVTGGIPVLGLVPTIKTDTSTANVESVLHPYSAATEAYRSIRTSLEFAAIEHKVNMVHITSSAAGEGKTTTAVNLAVSAASSDKRVILVDLDLRRPRAHEYFDLENDLGFTSILLGDCTVHEALQRAKGVPNLLVLTSGPPPPNPAELLSTKAARDLLQALTQPSDLVIIDSPPLLPVADSSIIAGFVDSAILVVNAWSARRREVERSLEMLALIDAPLEGVVLNGIGQEATYAGGYGYEPIIAAKRNA